MSSLLLMPYGSRTLAASSKSTGSGSSRGISAAASANPVLRSMSMRSCLLHCIATPQGRLGPPNRAQQRLHVGAAFMANAVDEEGRGPSDTTQDSVPQVALDLRGVAVLRHVLIEGLDLQAESGGVLVEMLITKSTLMLEELVVHLPEPALVRRGLSRLRRMLCVRVDLTQGKVPVHKANLITQLALHSPDDVIRDAAVGTFKVGVLQQRHRGCLRTLDVILSCDGCLQIAGCRVVGHGLCPWRCGSGSGRSRAVRSHPARVVPTSKALWKKLRIIWSGEVDRLTSS